MSVYKRDYRAYTGRVTPLWARIRVLVNYGLAEAWSSKITLGLFLLSLIPPVVFMVQIYLANNPAARMLILKSNSHLLDVDASFFLRLFETQCWLALPLASWIAPRLITFDLADNALPILLSHPISRFGYVMGKFIALAASLSCITWVPCLILFAYQGYSSEGSWTAANLHIAVGMLAGAAIWIALLSILGLAFSSWVKWRVVATGVIFAAVMVPAAVGGIVSAVLRTKWGFLLNIPVMMTQLWQRLLGDPEIMRATRDWSLPTAAIVCALLAICLVCFAMLNARIRAREVVRG
jgi:ABC-type transport system involved in multi-copper enzyme maturation permease subunit